LQADSQILPYVLKRQRFWILQQKLPLHGMLVSYPRKPIISVFHFTYVASAAGVALTQLSEQDTLAVEDSINRFITSVVPVHQMGAVHANDRHNLIVVHTLTQAALIRLYYLHGEVDQLWNEKCLLAARGMLLVIGQVTEMDIEFLDPIVGVRVSCGPRVGFGLLTRNVELLGVSCARLHS